MITAERVEKRFGAVKALDGVSFTADEGTSVALWGGNGAGKTTLIRCLLGILRHRGRIRVDGLDARTRGKAVRSRIGYVPQELAFHDDMRLDVAMGFFARLRRVERARCIELLERIGLRGHERKRVRDLSGGMKQRLAVGVAMLADPPVIVLEEPTSNLDAAGREDVIGMLRSLREAGKTIIFASHRPDEVLELADRVLVLEDGRLTRDVAPTELWPMSERIVRLHLAGGQDREAAQLLRAAGHVVDLNGHGLLVTVADDRKAEPISLLAESRLHVRNFEVIETERGE